MNEDRLIQAVDAKLRYLLIEKAYLDSPEEGY